METASNCQAMSSSNIFPFLPSFGKKIIDLLKNSVLQNEYSCLTKLKLAEHKENIFFQKWAR